ncbi:thioredoxin family protein [Streptacidiphilus sp. EB129]|uniref:thioredoxin family protein n=1 Tax=Streptacidiphilus sp. EB129 TaxID=3156262 RepID=UPI00351664A2
MKAQRRLLCVVAALAAVLALGGCVTVVGTGRGLPSAGRPRTGSDAEASGRPLGLARPFPPLPSVKPASVPDGYDPNQDAPAAVTAALAAARADGRPVLLDFGAGWCEDCTALSALVASPGIQLILSRNYHLVTVDVGQYDHNTELAARYVRLASSGIPALALLGPDGTVRHTTDDGSFAQARSMSEDQFANMLVDWLYPPYGNTE